MPPDDGFERCVGEVQNAGNMTREEAQGQLDLVDARSERLQDELGLSPEEATQRAARELYDAEAAAQAKLKANRYLNLQKRVAMRDRLSNMAEELGKDGEPDLVGAMRAQLVALLRPIKGGRNSVEFLIKQLRSKYINALDRDLKKAGLSEVVRKGTLDDQWAIELGELSKREMGEPNQFGMTGSKPAQQIAEIIHGYMTLAKRNLNKQGAWIGDIAGYITRQTHDVDKIRRAGFDRWASDMMQLLDTERTFEGIGPATNLFQEQNGPTRFLRSVYAALVSGVHFKEGERVGLKDPAFTGPANLAEKLSAERKLHFKDSASWLAYNKKYGTGRPIEQVFSALDRAAKSEGLMSRFGTNPRAEFDQHIKALEERYRDSNPEAVARLEKAKYSLGTLFDTLDGTSNIPANEMAAKISAGLRLLESTARLGGVAFSHLSSLVTKAAELRYQGAGFLESYGNFFSSLMPNSSEGRELADMMLAGHEGSRDGMVARFSWDDGANAWAARTAGTFFKYSGLETLLSKQKAGAMRLMSRYLGKNIEKPWPELSFELRRGLAQYDITPAEWDALRTAPDQWVIDGRVHLTPDAAMRATTDMSAEQREDLALRLRGYYADVADRGIVTPGVAERATLLRGARPGSVPGELARFVGQFKTWGVAATRQGLGRWWYGNPTTLGKIGSAMEMAIGTMLTGYAVMTLKDLFKGRDIRDPSAPTTWLAALAQGGGFGIMGDFAMADYSRFGGDIGTTILGPVLGEGLQNILRLTSDLRQPTKAHLKDARSDAFKMAEDNAPFLNLFYLRIAADYFFLHAVQDWMNPGYLQRQERNMKRDTGQTMWLSPTTGARLPQIATAPAYVH